MNTFLQDLHTKPIHSSWLVAWCSCGVLVGIAVGDILQLPITLAQAGVMACALIGMSLIKRRRIMVLVVLIAGLILGTARGYEARQATQAYHYFYGKSVHISGKVSGDATVVHGETRLQLTDVHIDNRYALPGEIWVSTNTEADIKRSDHVEFSGSLGKGFGVLPASMYQAKLISAERSVHGDVGLELRDWFARAVRLAIPEPAASLGVGFLVGQKSALPTSLSDQLKLIGLTHIVVASGYNLTILVRLARRSLANVSKYLATLAALGMLVGFVLITGFSPSMSRAALVTVLSLWAWYYGRGVQPLVLLAFAAAVTTMLHPSYIWGDIGWYLSFTSFAGVMILGPLLRHYFWGMKQQGTISQVIVETLSAQMLTLPIIAFVFGQYSLLSLPANVLVVPLIPFAMACTFAAGISSIFTPGLAHIIGWPATVLLEYMTTAVHFLSNLPWASHQLTFGIASLVACYGVIVGVCVYLWRKTGHNFGHDNVVE